MTQTPALAAAYAECERITSTQAKNFAWGIKLLPGPKRRALSAVYAFARRIDDIGDGELPPERKLAELAAVRDQLHRPSAAPDDPVLVALFDAAHRFPIPLAAFDEVIHGCEHDVAGTRYGSWQELMGYCRDVAGSVGRLSLGVFAPTLDAASSAAATGYADTLGLALQITNILRDIREDLTNGRIYLPRQDLDLFGCTLQLAEDGSVDLQDGALAELVRFEAARAGGLYDEGLKLLALLDRRSRACTAAMAGIYRELLTEIAANPSRIAAGRTSLPTTTKLRLAVQAFVA